MKLEVEVFDPVFENDDGEAMSPARLALDCPMLEKALALAEPPNSDNKSVMLSMKG